MVPTSATSSRVIMKKAAALTPHITVVRARYTWAGVGHHWWGIIGRATLVGQHLHGEEVHWGRVMGRASLVGHHW